MIKEPTNLENFKLNIYLKDGTEYLGKDTTKQPFGEYERVVGFWNDESIILIPLTEVKKVEMCLKK